MARDNPSTAVVVSPRSEVQADRMTLLLRTRPEDMTLPQVAEAVAILRAIKGVAARRDEELASFLKEGPLFEEVPADPRGHRRLEVGDVVLTLERRPALSGKGRRKKEGPLPAGEMNEQALYDYLKRTLSPTDLQSCTQVKVRRDRLEALVILEKVDREALETFFDESAAADEEAPIYALKVSTKGDLQGFLEEIEFPTEPEE